MALLPGPPFGQAILMFGKHLRGHFLHELRVRKLLLDQGYIRLAQLNEAYAIALYDRLLNADVYLSETAEVVESDAPRWSGEFREHLARSGPPTGPNVAAGENYIVEEDDVPKGSSSSGR